jgi:hypothetical protein
MNDLLSVIYRPRIEFKAVKDNQVSYVIVMLILVLLTIIQAVVSFPVQEQLMANNDIFANIPPDQAAKAKAIAGVMKYFGLIIAGVVYIMKILVQALMVWGGITLFKGKIDYKQSVLIVSLASFITILGDFANAGVIFMNGIEKVTSIPDLSKTGLNLLFDPEKTGLALYTLLAYINPFQVWSIIILITGFSIVGEMHWSNAVILCLILWFIWVTFPVFSVVLSEAARAKAGF